MEYNTEKIARLVTKLNNENFKKEIKLEFTDREIINWYCSSYDKIPTIRISNNINTKY